MACIDLTGQRFGRLVVTSLNATRASDGKARWNVSCDCGAKLTVVTTSLRRGSTKSCGCLRRDQPSPNFIHGMSKTPLHNLWTRIIDRCTRKKNPKYPRYGGRGIGIFPAWRRSFVAFATYVERELGKKPSRKHTLDRVDNDRGYVPGNIRWASPKIQMRNTSKTRRLTFRGKTMCMVDWAKETGIKRTTIRQRLAMGWSVERTLSTPIRNHAPYPQR